MNRQKYQQLLANWDTITDTLMNSKEEMEKFLSFSARMYKVRFSDAALTFLQNPEATKVADLKKWNNLKRFVKKGSHSICVFGDDYKPRSYFDVSQTFGQPLPKLWRLNYNNAERLLNDLNTENHNQYVNLEKAISELISQTLDDHISTFEALCEKRDLKNDEVSRLYDTIISTAKFIAFRRTELNSTVAFSNNLNLDAYDDLKSRRDFREMCILTQHTAHAALLNIERKVLKYIEEDNINLKEEINNEYSSKRINVQTQPDRTVRRSDGIYGRSGTAEASGTADPQMGQDVDGVDDRKLSAGERSSDNGVSMADNSTPDRYRSGTALERAGRDLQSTEPTSSRVRGDQTLGEGSSVLSGTQNNGGHSLSHQILKDDIRKWSAGDNVSGNDDVIVNNEAVVTSQLLPLLDLELVKLTLKSDIFISGRKKEIADFFKQNENYENRVAYIKKQFGTEYTDTNINGQRVGYSSNDNGMIMWTGSYINRTKESGFTWDIIQSFFAEMIEDGTFLDTKERKSKATIKVENSADQAEQLSLFGDPVPLSNTYVTSTKKIVVPKFDITDDIIDYALKAINCDEKKVLHIVTEFSKNKSNESNAEFLNKELAVDGRGIIYQNKKISIWWSENGVIIGAGESALEAVSSVTLSWNEAAEKINKLLNNGSFTSQYLIDSAPENEFREIAVDLWYLRQDCEVEYFIPNEMFTGGFDISTVKIAAEIQKREVAAEYLNSVNELADKYALDEDTFRFNSHARLSRAQKALNDIFIERTQFNGNNFEYSPTYFITDDEKNHIVSKGGNVQNSKFRIHEFFSAENHTPKEKIAFLKNEYGIGGSSFGDNRMSYNSKSLYFAHGNIDEPYAETEMKWSEISERLEKIISQNNYITDKDIEKRISNAQYVIDNRDDYEKIEIEDAEKILAEYHIEVGSVSAVTTEPTVLPENVNTQPVGNPVNYVFNSDDHISGGAKTKFNANIAALQTLLQIEKENRYATPEEQNILARYSGWGGIPQAFEPHNESWSVEYNKLKSFLTEKEYSAARASTLTSFYTPPEVIDGVYQALEQFGFNGGNVLEPSMGVGNFFAKMPETMRTNSNRFGVELDSVSGRIAKALYPEDTISIKGFEEMNYSNNSFDVVIGNIPFGDFHISDKSYNKYNFKIHDYFAAKAVDQVKPGGIVAIVTSKFTMDKKDDKCRKYLAERCELLGAIRLPNNTFKDADGVTTDILFLKKRESLTIEIPDWVHFSKTDDGIPCNQYFVNNPDMVLGTMCWDERMKGKYGENSKVTTCSPNNSLPLREQISNAVARIEGSISTVDEIGSKTDEQLETIPADPTVRNFTHTLVNGDLYFRENEIMVKVNEPEAVLERMKGLHLIRVAEMQLIDAQSNGCTDEELNELQQNLNTVYDGFVKQYGNVTGKINQKYFGLDDDYNTIAALEEVDDENTTVIKTEIFYKRTIKRIIPVTSVDTADEALQISLDRLGTVDISYMSQLTGKSPQDVITSLENRIFRNPAKINENDKFSGYEEASEYLSGNIRKKLKVAQLYAANDNSFQRNVTALTDALPDKIEASDISFRIGANWIEIEDYNLFLKEYAKADTTKDGHPLSRTSFGEYKIEGKYSDKSVAAIETFGTSRMSSYHIFENLLNQRDIVVRDRTVDVDNKVTYVVNVKETQLAKEKARKMKEAFKDWLWKDIDRREKYVEKYNELFNSIRGREYDGSYQTFPGMNNAVELKPHQKNAILRAKLNGNTLLAHAVGAGKTFEMASATMEKLRLGLINKACVVVPKHLTLQMATEWIRLYPNAKLLIARPEDFTKDNRQKFIARCVTGDYDAVIMAYTQFERIPMSTEYSEQFISDEINQIINAIEETDASERTSIKALERQKRKLEDRLDKLINSPAKDESLCFEKLGFDYLVVDEAHNYKNCFVATKMNNVAGVQTTAAQKSEDMLMKTEYLNNRYGCNNILFATGTPISNSMVELYVMQRYLRPDLLQEAGVSYFDDWASTFGEVVSSLEMKPAGDGYRMKNRFSKFVNIPELIQMYKEFADIQTADMLKLPVPELKTGEPIVVSSKPDERQRAYMQELAARSEAINSGNVDPRIDNMLKITHEARLLGLDSRCIFQDAVPAPDSKVMKLLDNLERMYHETEKEKGVQIIFCDIAVNEDDQHFSIYNAIKAELINRNIPEEEICFASDAKTDKARAALYKQLRSGEKRFILASTTKLGTGANIQDRICAIHHLDIPWRPADLIQQDGRGIRRGNSFSEVAIYHYLTEETFDAYMMGIITNKVKFINQIMTSKSPVRVTDDVDEMVLTYSQMQAVATGNPLIIEKIQLENDIATLKTLKSEHSKSVFKMQELAEKKLPEQISVYESMLSKAQKDYKKFEENYKPDEGFLFLIDGTSYTERAKAGEEIEKAIMRCSTSGESIKIGEFKGFEVSIEKNPGGQTFFEMGSACIAVLHGELSYSTEVMINNNVGNIRRIENLAINSIGQKVTNITEKLNSLTADLEEAKNNCSTPFEHEEELNRKSNRLEVVNRMLSTNETTQNTQNEELTDIYSAEIPVQQIVANMTEQERRAFIDRVSSELEAYIEPSEKDIELYNALVDIENELQRNSLFSIEQNGERREYINNGNSIFDLMNIASGEYAYTTLMKSGNQISSENFAKIQQSNNFAFSAEFNFDENEVRIYKVNGNVPEPYRTDENSSIKTYNLDTIKDLVVEIISETSDPLRRQELLEERLELLSDSYNDNLSIHIAEKQDISFPEYNRDGTDEEFNPYAYDGSMSPEDFRKMQLLNTLSDITKTEDDTPYKLIEAFEKTAAPDWKNNLKNIQDIKYSLLDILNNEHLLTEMAYTAISESSYINERLYEDSMHKAIQLINEYCNSTFGSDANFFIMDHVDLAYTTDEETEIPIQVYADLETFRIVKEYGGKIVNEELFDSLDNMNKALENLEFDELVSLSNRERADEIFHQILLPALAFDEQVAITDEFFNYEHAWHNVDKGIPELAERYRKGEDIREDLAKLLMRTSVNMRGMNFDYEITSNEQEVNARFSDIERTFTWNRVGELQLDYLKRTFKNIQLERVKEYPDVANEVNTLIERMENENYSERETQNKPLKSTITDEKTVPTITCEWSESYAFEAGKTYSVYEFDKIMKQADDERIAGQKAAIEKYGSAEDWYNSDVNDEFTQFMGYDKTKFTVNMPDGTSYTERQDIGDGFGGVIDFLSRYPIYNSIIPELKTAREIQAQEQSKETKAEKSQGKQASLLNKPKDVQLSSRKVNNDNTVTDTAALYLTDENTGRFLELYQVNEHSAIGKFLDDNSIVVLEHTRINGSYVDYLYGQEFDNKSEAANYAKEFEKHLSEEKSLMDIGSEIDKIILDSKVGPNRYDLIGARKEVKARFQSNEIKSCLAMSVMANRNNPKSDMDYVEWAEQYCAEHDINPEISAEDAPCKTHLKLINGFIKRCINPKELYKSNNYSYTDSDGYDCSEGPKR